ncbi:hypothetical protein ACIRPT_27115 [Streptomyces sp. NPDC101227]
MTSAMFAMRPPHLGLAAAVCMVPGPRTAADAQAAPEPAAEGAAGSAS